MSDFATIAMKEFKRSKRRERPTIPEPYAELASLRASVIALKEAVEILSGQRGSPVDAAVTWQDLLNMDAINKADIPKDIGSYPIQP